MKFEFHAHLSHLGFDGVYPMYWIKERKQDTRVDILKICMHKAFTIHARYNSDKTPIESRRHERCD